MSSKTFRSALEYMGITVDNAAVVEPESRERVTGMSSKILRSGLDYMGTAVDNAVVVEAGSVLTSNSRTIEFPISSEYPLILNDEECAQCFGVLRSRLLNLHSAGGIRSVIVTSPSPGEGKTLIALNLALSLGQLGRIRVLLVDGDLRRQSLSSLLPTQNHPGLSDFLRGRQPFGSIVQTTSFASLGIISAGTSSDQGLPEILEGPRWAEFLETAKQHFDLVVTDCLPAGAPVADFELLAAPCDALLAVVQIRKTTRESLARVIKRIDRSKLLGVLVNNADRLHQYNNYVYYGGKKRK